MNVGRLFKKWTRFIMGRKQRLDFCAQVRVPRARVLQVAGAHLRTQFHRNLEPLLHLLPSLWCHFFLKLDGCTADKKTAQQLERHGECRLYRGPIFITGLSEINPQPDHGGYQQPGEDQIHPVLRCRLSGWLSLGHAATAMVSILSSTVAKVSPASLRRSGAGVIMLTTTSTSEHTTNMKIA